MKEPDYVLSLMSKYNINSRNDGTTMSRHYRDENGKNVSNCFKYTVFINNHFQYRHVVHDINHNRMQPITLGKKSGIQSL